MLGGEREQVKLVPEETGARVTGPVNPWTEVTLTIDSPTAPGKTFTVVGLAVTVKS